MEDVKDPRLRKAGYVRRFSRIERLLHWVNALGFFFLLATGLILYLPRLSVLVSRRQMIQSIHFWGGVGWVAALVGINTTVAGCPGAELPQLARISAASKAAIERRSAMSASQSRRRGATTPTRRHRPMVRSYCSTSAAAQAEARLIA